MIKRIFDRKTARHRAGPGRPRVLGRFITGGTAVAAGAVLAVSLTASPGQVTAPNSVHISAHAMHLTAGEIHSLQHMTPAQETAFNQALAAGFGKLGIHAGIGTSPSAGRGMTGTHLTAYDWSGGVRWDHAWVTASYANLAWVVNDSKHLASVSSRYKYIRDVLFVTVCGIVGLVTGGWGGAVCGVLTAFIADSLDGIGNGRYYALTNHGIWAQDYWTAGYHPPGGTW